ncbi:MAG: BLUF domain-containing protein [Phycisphaeraceae bacterium]
MPIVHRLIFASRSTVSFDAGHLQRLAHKAHRNNAARDISGILLYGEGRFLNLLEGPRDAIHDLYDHKIVYDERHTDCEVLLDDQASYRLFPKWGMGRLFLCSDKEVGEQRWNALCNEIARQCPESIFAKDPVVRVLKTFADEVGEGLETVTALDPPTRRASA